MPTGHENTKQRYEDAAYAYTVGHFEEAMAGFSVLAESGDAKAAAYLGQMYLQGHGASQNVEKGLELLQRAASSGDSNAAFSLGALYRTGDCGVPRDSAASTRFFRLAQELGCELRVDDYL